MHFKQTMLRFAFNYGHGEDASDPRFGFARKCDYVSAAAVLIEAGFFEKLGGFDERYAPAFYEDTDLAFRVREAGRDVVCQPKSTVIHFGGASHGRDVSSGLKRYQISNQKKFRTRWKNRLASHYESDSNLEKSAIRLSGPRALVIDATMLMPDRDAGSLRMFNLIKVLQEMGFAMTFLPSDLSGASEYVENLQQSGIQVACLPHVDSVETYLQKFGSEFELCILSRPDTAEKNLDHVNLLCPNALVLYDTVDVHFLRRERELRLTGVAQSEDSIKKQELRAVRRAAGTIAVSEFDRGKFLEKVPNASIHVVSLIHEVQPQETPFSERDGILFIGGFQHGPNADAVLWFLNDIFPTVRSWIPDIRFHIVGTNPPDEIRDRACDHIIVEGFVEDVEEQFASRRLSIAPLRYGSGVKGKINQSMAYGLPCVATHTAVEGMDLKKDSEILVAEAEHEFAEAVAKLYQNEELWTCLARNSVSSIERSYSAKVARQGLVKILEYHGRELPKSSKYARESYLLRPCRKPMPEAHAGKFRGCSTESVSEVLASAGFLGIDFRPLSRKSEVDSTRNPIFKHRGNSKGDRIQNPVEVDHLALPHAHHPRVDEICPGCEVGPEGEADSSAVVCWDMLEHFMRSVGNLACDLKPCLGFDHHAEANAVCGLSKENLIAIRIFSSAVENIDLIAAGIEDLDVLDLRAETLIFAGTFGLEAGIKGSQIFRGSRIQFTLDFRAGSCSVEAANFFQQIRGAFFGGIEQFVVVGDNIARGARKQAFPFFDQNRAIAEVDDHLGTVRDKENRRTLAFQSFDPCEAFSREGLVPDGQNLVDDDDFRIHVDRGRKGQAGVHSRRVNLYGSIKKVADLGEICDGVDAVADFRTGEPHDRCVHEDVFTARELGVETGSQSEYWRQVTFDFQFSRSLLEGSANQIQKG